jgi:hypothetical protein
LDHNKKCKEKNPDFTPTVFKKWRSCTVSTPILTEKDFLPTAFFVSELEGKKTGHEVAVNVPEAVLFAGG